MKKYVIFIVSFSLMYACKSGEVHDYCQYVDPFIGTADNGHTFPGATAPFGFIQASPETGNDAWKYCSGYNYDDNSIIGFAQNHLNGTGCSDLGDILMLPFTEGDLSDGNYRGSFKKSDEKASPGYYSVKLNNFDIDVELTATQRTAFHRYTFNKNAPANLLLDMQNGVVWSAKSLETHVLNAEINMPDNKTLTGRQQVRNWVTRQYCYVIKFDRPYTVEALNLSKENMYVQSVELNGSLYTGKSISHKDIMKGGRLVFTMTGEPEK
ncbi:MAG: glycoside hydrolase family 92 protein [Prevotellaceae bacterium]|jgi:putative alpha-1,2-mannosidase|nr:glycoside hydrolase family 92 protein [Prevotellaceae bacterium]